MVLVRVATLADLVIPADHASSKVHHAVKEVRRQPLPTPLAPAAPNAVAFSHRLGLSNRSLSSLPSLSPLSLRSGSNNATTSPICKPRVGGLAHNYRGNVVAGARQLPLQPKRRPCPTPPGAQRSHSLPASPLD